MEVIFQSHHAVISPNMRLRAERVVRRIARRLPRPVDAIVRFEQDGPIRRVELVLHASQRKDLIAEGFARYYGPALNEAASKLLAQVNRQKRTPKTRGRTLARR